MVNMERHGQLTYERLVNSLARVHDTVAAQFPELGDTQRAQDLQRAIKDALIAARSGMSGAAVASPVQLKRDVRALIAKIHAQHDTIAKPDDNTKSNSHASFSRSGKNISPHLSTQEGPAPKRTRCSPDSGKENLTPPFAAPLPTATCASSAVRKTLLTKRASSTKGSKPTGIKKRPLRTPHGKPAVHALETPLNRTDEADRRAAAAAAAALLGLAEQSPMMSFTSTPPRNINTASSELEYGGVNRTSIRGRSVHEDKTEALLVRQNPERTNYTDGSPPLKCGRTNGSFAPLPRLDAGISVQRAFAMGVEYAVMHFSSDTQFVSTELQAGECVNVGGDIGGWVGKQLGLRDSAPLDRASGGEQAGAVGSVAAQDAESRDGGARKGFWDVV